MKADVVIVGGGLSGLYVAYRLQQAGVDYRLLEARVRLGGRVHGEACPDPGGGAVYDLGPAWIWPDFQPLIAKLLVELGVCSFEQYLAGDDLYEGADDGPVTRSSGPSAMRGSYRISGGTSALIDALAAAIPPDRIHLSSGIERLVRRDACIDLFTTGGPGFRARAGRVVLALPPRLMARTVQFEPLLPEVVYRGFIRSATWMAGHAKVVALYDSPFWRASGLSGEGFSRRGPLTEIHDASPEKGGPYALFGFVGYSPDTRQAMGEASVLNAVRQQLQRMFGTEAATPLKVLYKDWARDPYTATMDDLAVVSGHPAYGLPPQARGLWSGRLLFAATEAATQHGGYLEGALEASDQALRGVLI